MSDEKIKQYFLGLLPVNEAEQLEIELSLNDGNFDHAQTVEADLIDDFLTDQLSRDERESFIANYAVTEERLNAINTAKAFLYVMKIDSESSELTVSSDENRSIWNIFGLFPFRPSFAAASALLLFMIAASVAIGLWIMRPVTEVAVVQVSDDQEVPESTSIPTPSVEIERSDNPDRGNANDRTSRPDSNRRDTSRPNVANGAKSPLATVTLVPGTLRGDGGQTVNIQPQTETITIRLVLPPVETQYLSYSAVLRTADGDEIIRTSETRKPQISIRADKLENRTYVVILTAITDDRTAQPIAEYTFRVKK